MVPPPESRRSPALARLSITLLLVAAAWDLTAPLTFIGARAPHARSLSNSPTQMRGYRLDWMLEKKDGTMDLQTQDGYWVGETGFEKAQQAQGYRYRMRPTYKEYAEGKEVDGLMFQLGPIKLKLGEMFGGTGNNEKLRELKRKIARDGITDPKKIEENEYWLKRYGHKRWESPYVDQSTGLAKNFLRGVAAWSGYDPLKEERGVTWFEADYGKPWLAKYIGMREPGWVSAEQVQKEYATGRLLKAPEEKK
mmetsp:Transcript_25797/g.81436  ORF Transcript_25797/g.81436 Transcript_25797/m.81436 type:complete len:251 (+) Transcript_25797:66-818(+)